jgi:uncharacterized protein (DUF488 family)
MTKQVYTIGYSGRKLTEIQRIAESLDATIFDVRISNRSRNRAFNGRNLREVLGDRYQHVKELGNVNYRKSGMEHVRFLDLEAGLEKIANHPQPVILMCVCKHDDKCHRSLVADELRERGCEVEPAGAYQLTLL